MPCRSSASRPGAQGRGCPGRGEPAPPGHGPGAREPSARRPAHGARASVGVAYDRRGLRQPAVDEFAPPRRPAPPGQDLTLAETEFRLLSPTKAASTPRPRSAGPQERRGIAVSMGSRVRLRGTTHRGRQDQSRNHAPPQARHRARDLPQPPRRAHRAPSTTTIPTHAHHPPGQLRHRNPQTPRLTSVRTSGTGPRSGQRVPR